MSLTEGFNGVISPKITNSKIKSDFFLAFLDLILMRTSQCNYPALNLRQKSYSSTVVE